MEVKGFEEEWRIEAEGKDWKINSSKGRVPPIIWGSNRTSTLQHPRPDFAEVSTASTSAPCSCSRTFSAKALHAGLLVRSAMYTRMAGLGSEGAREGKGGSKPCDYILVGLCGGCRIVLQRVLAYTDVLIVYEHLCMFPDRWPVSWP